MRLNTIIAMKQMNQNTRNSVCGLLLSVFLLLSAGCESPPDTMDTDAATNIVAAYIARIDSTQYKIYELSWYDNDNNSLEFASMRLLGRNDSCYEYTIHRSFGSPDPQIKLGTPRTVHGFKFSKVRSIDFDYERRFVLPNIEKMKKQIPEENKFKSVRLYSIVCRPNGELHHSIIVNLDGEGVNTRRASRRSLKVDYRKMRGIMREGKELDVKIDKIR